MYTKQDLQRQMAEMGLVPTDVVLIHTSFKSVGAVENGPDGFLDAFCDYLCDGLFIVPTHSWKFVDAEHPVYDVRSTTSNLGLIPRTAAVRSDGVRSLHPTHSMWAHGKDAAAFVSGEENAPTPTHPGYAWSRLAEIGAKILLIGVGNNRNTFIHSIDQQSRFSDRFMKNAWHLTSVDYDGIPHDVTMHQFDFDSSVYFGNFDRPLTESGAQKMSKLGDAEVRIVDAAKCRDVLSRLYERASYDPCRKHEELPESWWK